MFDGTDLSVAYGNSFDSPMQSQQQQYQNQNPHQQQMQQPDPTSLQLPKSTTSHAMAPDPSYAPPPAMYAQQSAKPPPNYSGPPSDSFWDRIAGKKWEVFKLFVMSLIIMLAISMDHVAHHYMGKYIGSAFLTETQELLVRLSYPVAILLVIWMLKAGA